MLIENRNRIRFNPDGLTAQLSIAPFGGDEVRLTGEVLDMSYSGIKIKLQQPLTGINDFADLRITLILPESGIPVCIHGIIKHIQSEQEIGLQYIKPAHEEAYDDLMFECIKLVPDNIDYTHRH